MRAHRYLLAILLVLGGLSSCAQFNKPDLERLYRYQQGNPNQPPIILIPGLLGSRLSDANGKEVWPGSAFKLLFSDYDQLKLKVNPDTLEPEKSDLLLTGLTDTIIGQDYYGRLREVLESAGGFVESVSGTPARPGERRYYVLAYDWRQDNLAAVRKLDSLIEAIRRDYQDPDLKVDVIAHSMGGMITRYYIRYGTSDELTDNEFQVNNYGASRIRRAILLGTPNLGSTSAVKAIINGFKIGFGELSDWRQDNLAAVRKLDSLIEAIRRDYQDPDLKVDVIAHSMGGMITRYYIRYGTSDELTDNEFQVNNYGASRIRRAILLGTPNLGSTSAVKAIINGFKIGFGELSPELIASWPSSYQLLPHPISQWLLTVDGRALNRDLFDVETWRRFQFSIFDPKAKKKIISQFKNASEGREYLRVLQSYFAKHLERARRYVWSLTVKAPHPDVKIIVFGGDCRLTPARLVVEEVDGKSVLRYSPNEIRHPNRAVDYDRLMMEPGDGRVTKASLLARRTYDPTVQRHEWSFINIEYAFFLCSKHTRLTGNPIFQDNLLHAILSIDEETHRAVVEE